MWVQFKINTREIYKKNIFFTEIIVEIIRNQNNYVFIYNQLNKIKFKKIINEYGIKNKRKKRQSSKAVKLKQQK